MPVVDTASHDLIVIGGGPAGYTAALRASQLGARTVLVEEDRLGGACLNRACVPTKFLRFASELTRSSQKSCHYGVKQGETGFDWTEVQSRLWALVKSQEEGLNGLVAENDIKLVRGEGRVISVTEVGVNASGTETIYLADRIIVATGSKPANPDIPGIEHLLNAWELLALTTLPRSLGIIGGGPVGVELGTIFSRFGVAVSIIEIMPHLLPGEDAELAGMLEHEMKKNGVQIFTESQVESIERAGDKLRLAVNAGGKLRSLEVEKAAACAGWQPDSAGFGLEELGIRYNHSAIVVDEHLYTGKGGIYAAGDATGKAMLAYVAMMQGKLAAENSFGRPARMTYDVIPRCIYGSPEFSSVGLTEQAARDSGMQIKVGRFPFSANMAANIYGERRGMVKIVAEAGSGRVLGAHILGPSASLLIHEAAIAIKMKANLHDLQSMMHAHPNLAEALWEASLDADGAAISFKKPKI